ncbi:MAG TPA: ImmA/IrrE family metallo-endopeptidase [Candidatus Baltobacteraceae bacterium]
MPNPVIDGVRRAAAVRKQAGIPQTSPVDVSWLAEELGLVVVRRPMPGGLSGMHYAHPKGRSFVAINSTERSLRQNFTLAHEIGHHLFDCDQTIVEALDDEGKTPVERRANAFAANLLLPDAAIEDWKAAVRAKFDLDDVARLAIRYQLSYEATLFRLKSARVISDVDPFRDKTPMAPTLRNVLNASSEVAFEAPVALAKMADEALERHIISQKRYSALLADLDPSRE